jgi:hypothetical protein
VALPLAGCVARAPRADDGIVWSCRPLRDLTQEGECVRLGNLRLLRCQNAIRESA